MTDHQPMQPVIVDEHGTHRFKDNAVVRYLLDRGGLDLDDIQIAYQRDRAFPPEDMRQFHQLIGYSVSGSGSLTDYLSPDESQFNELDPAWDAATPGNSDAECIVRVLDLARSTSSANLLAQIIEALHNSPTGMRRAATEEKP